MNVRNVCFVEQPSEQHFDLYKPEAEAWLGMLNGVYALSMTLIAIQLATLTLDLLKLGQQNVSIQLVVTLIMYEVIIYSATCLTAYDLWSVHRSILRQCSNLQYIHNFINGGVLALSCVLAGAIRVLLEEKTDQAISSIESNNTFAELMNNWLSGNPIFSLGVFLIIAVMYILMSMLAQTSGTHRSSTDLRDLIRNLRYRSLFFAAGSMLWIPVMFGGPMLIPPAFLVIFYFLICFNHRYFSSLIKRLRSHN